ncbi:CAP domain-containing protein [Bacillus pakistanensis]|nr:CAP domain-containing protein [Bacillus pakistanensis]
MKIIIRTLIVLIFLIIFGIYTSLQKDENSMLEGPDKNTPQLDKENKLSEAIEGHDGERPNEGLSVFIGKSIEEVIAEIGEPVRIDPSSYGYDWWIYKPSPKEYFQIGVDNSKVVTVFAIGEDVNVAPFTLGQSIDEIYRFTIVDSEIVVNNDNGTYQFELSEEDLNTRLLAQFGDIYAQLYLDKYSGKLMSIRYFNEETLVKQRPYEMVYRGQLIEEKEISDEEWEEIDNGSAQQIFDITNMIRKNFKLSTLEWDKDTSLVANGHSKDMFNENYFSHDSPTFGSLSDRLESGNILFQKAGENIAAKYTDGPAAVHGWLNSEAHRETMLDDEFTHIGIGVYHKYYTQNYIKKMDE